MFISTSVRRLGIEPSYPEEEGVTAPRASQRPTVERKERDSNPRIPKDLHLSRVLHYRSATLPWSLMQGSNPLPLLTRQALFLMSY